MKRLTTIHCLPSVKWLCTIVPVLFIVCNNVNKDYHPEYFAKFHTQLDSTAALTKRLEILDSLESALQQYPGGIKDKVLYYRARTSWYLDVRNYPKVFVYIDSAEQLVKNRKDDYYYREVYVSGLTVRSKCYLRLRNYDAALNYLLKAKSEKNSNKSADLAFFNERMAELYYEMRRYRVAAGYFKKAWEQTILSTDKKPYYLFQFVQGDIDNIGLCFAGAEMYDSASYYYKKALDYINKNEPLYPQYSSFINLAKAVVKANIARVKFKERRYEESEKMSLESINVTKGVYEDFTVKSSFELAETYIEWKKLYKAEKILEGLDSLYHFRQSPGDFAGQNMDWNRTMQKLWIGKKDTTQAFIYNKKYLALRDSLDLLEKKNAAHDLKDDLENRQQQIEKKLLERQNIYRSFQLAIAAIFTATAIGVVLFVWNNFRRTTRQERTLQALNQELRFKNDDIKQALSSQQQIQEENTKITRMVAHDLKNPIGGIRNLLFSFIKKQLPGELRDKMEEMNTDCTSCISIINELIKEEQSRFKQGAAI